LDIPGAPDLNTNKTGVLYLIENLIVAIHQPEIRKLNVKNMPAPEQSRYENYPFNTQNVQNITPVPKFIPFNFLLLSEN